MSLTKKQAQPDILSRLLDTPWHFITITLVFMLRGGILNPHLFDFEQILLYTAITVGIVYAVFLLFKYILLLHYAGLSTTIGVVLFFSYGNIYEALARYILAGETSLPVLMLNNLPVIYLGSFSLLVGLLILQKREFKQLTTFLNVVALTMLIGVLYNSFAVVTMMLNIQQNAIENPALLAIDLPATPPDATPDVYYIILDGYPGNAYLQDHFGIDNHEFTQQLADLGFYVADDSVSNYTYTIASLSSSLNMTYVQNLASAEHYASEITSFIVDNRTAKTFQEMGYDYIVVSSGYLDESELANLTIDVDSTGKLVYLDDTSESTYVQRDYMHYLYRTSFLRIFDPTLARISNDLNSWVGGERVAPQYAALKTIADIETPTFTFFHVTKPHTPVVVDEQGNPFFWTDYYANLSEYLENEEEHFAAQLRYVNNMTLDAVREILAQSDEAPIIVIQGDHALQLERTRGAIEQQVNYPIPILNAYYFPDQDYENLTDDITPINTFRIILNQYFDIPYETLAEKSYYQPRLVNIPDLRPLEFIEIAEGSLEPPFQSADTALDE